MLTEKLVECTAEEYQVLEDALKKVAEVGEITHGSDVGRTHGMGTIMFMGVIVADWRWTFEGKNVRKWSYRWADMKVDNLRKCRARDAEIKQHLQDIADGPVQPSSALSVLAQLPPVNFGEWVPPFGQFASHRIGNNNQPSRRRLGELKAPQYNRHHHDITIDNSPRMPVVSSQEGSALRGVEGRLTQQERYKAEAWEKLTALLGYVENGTSEVVTLHQDDATRSYIVKVGPVGMSHTSARNYYDGDTLAKAVDAAFMGEVAGRG